MSARKLFFLTFLVFFLTILNPVVANKNITVDDTDPSVSLTGKWKTGAFRSTSYNGSHQISNSSDATAIFKFAGTAIYYLSPLIPGRGSFSTNITLDSNPSVPINVSNPTNVSWAIHWSAEGLSNGPHTLVLSPTTPDSIAVIDGFIYTVSPTNKVRTIVGSIIGGIAVVLAAILAAVLAHKFAYLLKFLARRLIFKINEHLENTEIVSFMSEHENWKDASKNSSDAKLLVWKVNEIGGSNQSFDLSIPCESPSGTQILGYGTVDQTDGIISSLYSGKSPASFSVDNGNPNWTEDARSSPKEHTFARFTNELDAFTLGTYDETRDTPLEPFLRVDATGKDGKHNYPTRLFLHIFRSNGYRPGQYRDDLNKLDGDSLLPNGKGLAVSKIAPLTTWVIKSLGNGRLGVVVGKNDLEDIKRYEHDFKLHKSATRKQEEKV